MLTGVSTEPVSQTAARQRRHNLIGGSGRSWNGSAIGTPVLVPYSFATRDFQLLDLLRHRMARRVRPHAIGSVRPRSARLRARSVEALGAGLRHHLHRGAGRFRKMVRRHPLPARDALATSTIGAGGRRSVRASPTAPRSPLQRRLYADDPMRPGQRGVPGPAARDRPRDRPQAPLRGQHRAADRPRQHHQHGDVLYGHRQPLGSRAVRRRRRAVPLRHNAAEEALAVRWSRGPDGALVSTGNDAANTITGDDVRDIVRARRRRHHPTAGAGTTTSCPAPARTRCAAVTASTPSGRKRRGVTRR